MTRGPPSSKPRATSHSSQTPKTTAQNESSSGRGWAFGKTVEQLSRAISRRWATEVGHERYAIFEDVLKEIAIKARAHRHQQAKPSPTEPPARLTKLRKPQPPNGSRAGTPRITAANLVLATGRVHRPGTRAPCNREPAALPRPPWVAGNSPLSPRRRATRSPQKRSSRAHARASASRHTELSVRVQRRLSRRPAGTSARSATRAVISELAGISAVPVCLIEWPSELHIYISPSLG